jgi:ABC-type glycerol-3-phosphate transport system permease component
VTFTAYRSLLGSQFLRYILNSVLVATTSTLVTVVISVFAAYSFSRYRFRGRTPLLGVFAFSQLFPFVVILTPLYIFFYKLHLVNTYLGLIIAYTAITLPFCVYMLLGYFQSVPVSLDEAAFIDGSSTFGVVFRIVLPVAWPGIVATAVYVFIQSWNEFLFALTLMTDNTKKTIPVGLSNFFGQYTTDWGAVMSASVIATVPTLIFFLFMQRQLVAGLAAGAVKQ